MTEIKITTETPTEMFCLLNLVRKMEVENREPVPEMQKKRILSGEMPAVAGLGKACKEGGKTEGSQTEEAVGKLIEDLRADACWLETSPLPEELIANVRKAARILEIQCNSRELHRCCEMSTDESILDVIKET